MNLILTHTLIAALFSFGWCTAFDTGEIFGKIGDWLDKKLPEYIAKPLYACPKCNAAWVALIMDLCFWHSVWYVVLIQMGCAIGFNGIILKIYGGLKDIADVLEEAYEET